MLKPWLEVFPNVHVLEFLRFYFFWLLPGTKKPKAWKTDTAPYTGILGSQRGSNHDAKNNEYLFSQFIPHAFESEVLLFKKERIIRSKERKDNVSDHFANQNKWHSQKEDLLSYDRLRVFQRKNKKKTKESFGFNSFLWNCWVLGVQLKAMLGVNILSIFEYQVHKVPFEIRYRTD